MTTPVTVQNKIKLLQEEAEKELAAELQAKGQQLNNDHTLVLDLLVLAPRICRPLFIACELMTEKNKSPSEAAERQKLKQHGIEYED